MKLINLWPLLGLSTRHIVASFFTTKPTTPKLYNQHYGKNCGMFIPPNEEVGGKIVNGTAVNIRQAPWQVYLSVYKPNGGEFCGGSIISPQWVVTAAHCYLGKNRKVYIYSGTSHERPGTNTNFGDNLTGYKMVAVWRNHPDFNLSDLRNDIALAKVKYPWKFEDRRRPICLPTHDFCLDHNTPTMVTGFGRSFAGGPKTIHLSEAQVGVRSSTECNTNSHYSVNIPYSMMMCAGFGLADSCQGDSGGPLTYKIDNVGILTGLVSWGKGCSSNNYPGIYTHVANYVYWIAQVTGVYVADQDYDTTPQINCEMDGDSGNIRTTSTIPDNGLYDEEIFGLRFFKTPFPRGTVRYTNRCVNWYSMTNGRSVSLLGKKSRQCKNFSKKPVSFQPGTNRPFVRYSWETMMIEITPPKHRPDDNSFPSFCLSSTSKLISRTVDDIIYVGKRKKNKRKGPSKSEAALYFRPCDENDVKQKFIIGKNDRKLRLAYRTTECVSYTKLGGRNVLYLTNKMGRCKPFR